MSVFCVPSVFQLCSEHGATKRVPVFHPLQGEHGEHGSLESKSEGQCVPKETR